MQARVDSLSPAALRMSHDWPLLAALTTGTSAMRAAGPRFLPKWPKEDDASYSARLATAVLFPAFKYTISVMASKPFTRPMNWGTEPPAQLLELLDDVDRQGTNIHAFAAGILASVLKNGVAGVLVDYPPALGIRTIADEQAAGVRPYMVIYEAPAILGWRVENTPSGPELVQLRLLEIVTEPDGEWGEVEIKQVRVLTPGAFTIYRKDAKGDWIEYETGVMSISRIPFVFFYGERDGYGVGSSPLIDLAHLNVEHWQSTSDQQTILHVARVPILFAKGFSEGENLTVGANAAVRAFAGDADLKYVEHTGAAIDAGRLSILDLEDRMRQAGAELLVQRPAIATATQVKSESEAQRSILQMIVETFEESLEETVELMCEWIGLKFDPEIELFKDFSASEMSDKAGDLLLRAAGTGIVSKETAFRGLQRMDVVHPSVDWEEEGARIADSVVEEDSRAIQNEKARADIVPALAKLKSK